MSSTSIVRRTPPLLPALAGIVGIASLVGLAAVGCQGESPESTVVVYAALDREFSEPILQRFEKETGVRVLAKYDVESTKTVGLVNALIQEQKRPRCDLFWNNEVLHTLRLERLGLLAVGDPRLGEPFPPETYDPQGRWFGLAARARVLIVNTELVPAERRPASVLDLADPRWRGTCGIAKPLFGTTATHAAVLFARWGEQRAEEFFRNVRQNVAVLSGNKQVATAVGRGQLAFGLTDTDDAVHELESGSPVTIVFPDQEPDGLGTLRIPNTVARIRGARNAEAAERLIAFLLSGEVESRLAAGPSAQIPLRRGLDARARVLPAEGEVRWMAVDFAAAAERWETAASRLRDVFETAD